MEKIILAAVLFIIGCGSTQPEPQDSEVVIIDGHEYFKCGENPVFFHKPDCVGCKIDKN